MKTRYVALIVVVALTAVGVGASPASATETCVDYKIFAARGTDAVQGEGPLGLGDISGDATRVLEHQLLANDKSYSHTAVVYPATLTGYDPTDPSAEIYDLSVNDGVDDLTDKLHDYRDDCPSSKVILVGYSQGAEVTSRGVV